MSTRTYTGASPLRLRYETVNVMDVVGEAVRGETLAFSSLVGPLTAAAGNTRTSASSAMAADEAANPERMPLRGMDEPMNDKMMMPPRRAQVPDVEPEHLGCRAGTQWYGFPPNAHQGPGGA